MPMTLLGIANIVTTIVDRLWTHTTFEKQQLDTLKAIQRELAVTNGHLRAMGEHQLKVDGLFL